MSGAFALANRAMLMQMVHAGRASSGSASGGRRASREPDYDDAAAEAWRPFQLAFLLLTIESAALDESPDRDLVDLIWFPTGGGKTEAYLGLAAFTIFYRRLARGDAGAGTTVITRYTLRLLTAQQFQRAATLVCACELIRREITGHLGKQADLDWHLDRWQQQSQHVCGGRGPVGADQEQGVDERQLPGRPVPVVRNRDHPRGRRA